MELLYNFRVYLQNQTKPASKVTVKNYLSDISRFIRWFEAEFSSFSAELITPQIIERFRESSDLTMSSLERNLSSLRKFFHFLVLEGLISHSPFEPITNNSKLITADPYRLKAFKDYLYVYNASSLTIKNYLADIRNFIKWLEEVSKSGADWEIKDKNIFSIIDTKCIKIYKERLLAPRSLDEVGFSPRTINRKLSSIRKYITWAHENGYIHSLSQISNLKSQKHSLNFKNLPSTKTNYQLPVTIYSSFPPLRLLQKTFHGFQFALDSLLINPIASLVRAVELIKWRLQGKPVFQRIRNQESGIRNLPKDFFAPLDISTKNFSLLGKLVHHLKFSRPEWYKIYHNYTFTHYLHLGILILVISLFGFNLYQNYFQGSLPAGRQVLGITNPKSPPRIFSFQGRLTDASDNPITAKTDLRFGIYDALTGTGSALLWQEVQGITPDTDGVFSVLLGTKSTMQQTLFAEHAGLWLGVTVGQTAELTPRQQLASVAYAQNAETLQGLPPITDSGAGTTNTVLALDSSGNLTIGGSATPKFQATGGKFTLSGSVLSLTTVSGSNSNIELSPDGRSFIDLQKPLQNTSKNNNISTALGAVEVNDLFAVLATSSGQSAFTINQNDTGPILSASSSGAAKFTVSNAGGGTFADDLAVNGGDFTTTATTFNLVNTTATTLNIGGAATTINLGATTGTTTTANSLTILGNTTLGDTASDTLTVTAAVSSNVLPDANNTRNLGSSALRYGTVFGVNGDFTNISGTVTGGSTTSSSWTVNSDNATANAEIGSLAFETGTANFNAVLQWNASGDAGRISGFDNTNLFNFPVGIFSQVSGANQTFTSGTLFKYSQPAAHAITQSAAFIGTDYDFSTNITVPNTSSGNQTGFKTTLKDGGASATAIGYQTAGTLDFGLDIGGTIGTAEIRLSNGETIANTTDGTIALGGANLRLDAGKTIDLASAGALNIGDTNGTTLTLGSGGALTRTISIGTGTGADTINIGTGTVTADTISIGGLSTTTISTAGAFTHTGSFSQSGANTFGTGTGAISLNGDVTVAADKNLTLASGGGRYIQTFNGTTTNAKTILATAITTGNVLDLQTTSTAATSSDLIQGDHTASYTSTTTVSGNLLDLVRDLTINQAATTLTVSGAVSSLSSNCTQSAGTCTDSGNILSLTQSYASATGGVLNISNSGSGADILFNTSPILRMADAGTLVIDDGTNTLISIADQGTNANLTVSGDTAVNGGDLTTSATTFNLVNATATTVNFAGAATTLSIGAATGTTTVNNALTVTGAATFNGALAANTDVDFVFAGTENFATTSDLSGTVNVFSIIGTPSATAGTTRGIFVQQADSANTNGLDTAFLIDNADTNLALTTGIQITNTGGGGFTNLIDTPSFDVSGTGAITGATGVSSTTGTFSSAIAANGGITFDASTDTLGAFTAGGTIDMSTQILTNIGNTGTDFVASTGALTLAGVLTANGGVTIAGGQNLTLASGTGVYSQTFTGTTTNPFAITASAITTGNVLDISNTSTAATSSDLIQGDHTATYIAATTVSGQLLDLSRALTINAAATTLTVSGAVATITDNCTVTAGTCTSTADVLSITQSYASNSGAALNVTTAGTGLALRVNDDGTLTDSTPFAIDASGQVGIGTTAPSAQLQVNTGATTTIGQIIKAQASQTADLLQIRSSLDAVLAKIDASGNLTANTLTSSVAQGTAPLTVTSTTVVANLNAAAAQQPNPNLVLNSDFSRRNKFMTFMPEVFTDTSGWTLAEGTTLGTVASNTLTAGNTGVWAVRAGLSTWRDARFSAQVKETDTLANGLDLYVLKYANSNSWVGARIITNGTFAITKNTVAGGIVNVTTVAQTFTLNNWYWMEVEFQGTTVIAKLYSSGASPVAKSSATLLQTLTGTVSDAELVAGYAGLRSTVATASQWGGLSTGDGGVYVEGWGPEGWTVELNGTKGGQAIGFDEAADSGPIEKQWAMRAYIPATSRNIEVYQDTPDGSVLASTSYISSMYLKTSGKGGSGSLVRLQFQRMNSAITQQGSTTVDDAGETSWTRVNSGAITTETGTRRARIRAHINASGTATGTGLFLLPQLEQGGIVTPWRNAPADDGPITWRLYSNAATNLSTTDTTGATEAEPRDLAGNVFLPWDAGVSAHMEFLWRNDVTGNQGYAQIVENGNSMADSGTTVPFVEDMAVSGEYQMFSGTLVKGLSAGKHRIAIRWGTNSGTQSIFRDLARTPTLTITASRGKFDLAEEYTVLDQSIEAGDVVRLAPETLHLGGVTTIERTDKGYDSSVLGIVSTAPGITLSSTVELNSYQEKPNLRPVALQGRVPVKVTNENGPIYRGDILTSSSIKPGYAMKATRAGRSIGIAMEDFACEVTSNQSLEPSTSNLQALVTNTCTGKVMTFVNLSFYDPDVYLADSGEFIIRKSDNGLGIAASIDNRSTSNDTGSQTQNCEQTTDASNFGLISSCPKEPNPIEQAVEDVKVGGYIVRDSLGKDIERVQVAASIVVGNLKAGIIESQEIKSPIAEIARVQTDVISPLSGSDLRIRLGSSYQSLEASSSADLQAQSSKLLIENASGSAVASIDDEGVIRGQSLEASSASISGTLSSSSLTSDNATISGTLKTKNLIADNIESLEIKVASLSGLAARIVKGSSETSNQTLKPIDIASYSAQLAQVDTLQAQVGTFMQGLFAVGPSSLSDATVFGQLSVGGNLILADNSINVLGSDLEIQPLGQGGVSFLAGKVRIDESGNLDVSGNATVRGTLFANVLSPIPGGDIVVRLSSGSPYGNTASESAKFVVQNASGSAVLSVNDKGDIISEGEGTFKKLNIGGLIAPALATSETELIATGSAGIATISVNLKEVTVRNTLVTDKSLIYITPVGTPSAQIPFLLRQVSEDKVLGNQGSFTVGTQDVNAKELPFNWLIIN